MYTSSGGAPSHNIEVSATFSLNDLFFMWQLFFQIVAPLPVT
jgi:hypothetical protein